MAKRYSLASEFFLFLKLEKKWWLGPFLGVLLLVGAVLVLTEGSVITPFLYPFF